MNARTRVLRTVGFNMACLASVLLPLWGAQALTAKVLVPHGVVEKQYDFYTNFERSQ